MSAPARPGGPAGPAVPVGGGPVEGGLEHDPGRGATAPRGARGGPGGRARPARAGLLAVGLVVALAAVATTTLAVVSLLVRQDTTGAAEVADVTAVRVENRCGGDVELTGLGYADSGQVTVAWDDAWSLGRPRHNRSLEAGRLVVRVECPTATVGVGSASRLRVQVPGGLPVEVSAGSGDVTAVGLVSLGSVRTGSGDVEVTAVADAGPGAGRTTVRVGSGDVVLRGLGGALDVVTGSGSVRADDLTAASVRVSTGSGDADLSAVEPPRALVASTGSGDLTVTVPDSPSGYAVTATTGSGDALVGVARDPSSPLRMTLRTGSGDVDVVAGPPATR